MFTKLFTRVFMVVVPDRLKVKTLFWLLDKEEAILWWFWRLHIDNTKQRKKIFTQILKVVDLKIELVKLC